MVEGWPEDRVIRGYHDPQADRDTQDEDILIADEDIVPDDGKEPLGPDRTGFYTFFLEGQGNPPNLMGADNDQLLAIQNDLQERLKARDEAREREVTRKLRELEQKHEFANTQFLKHFAQVSELLEPMNKDAKANVKLADKILMLPPCLMAKNWKKQRLIMKDLISILSSKPKKVTLKIQQRRPLNYWSIHLIRKL